MADESYTYVVSVRETVDTQYIIRVPSELTQEAIDNLGNAFDTMKILGQAQEATLARNVREREIADVMLTRRGLTK